MCYVHVCDAMQCDAMWLDVCIFLLLLFYVVVIDWFFLFSLRRSIGLFSPHFSHSLTHSRTHLIFDVTLVPCTKYIWPTCETCVEMYVCRGVGSAQEWAIGRQLRGGGNVHIIGHRCYPCARVCMCVCQHLAKLDRSGYRHRVLSITYYRVTVVYLSSHKQWLRE